MKPSFLNIKSPVKPLRSRRKPANSAEPPSSSDPGWPQPSDLSSAEPSDGMAPHRQHPLQYAPTPSEMSSLCRAGARGSFFQMRTFTLPPIPQEKRFLQIGPTNCRDEQVSSPWTVLTSRHGADSCPVGASRGLLTLASLRPVRFPPMVLSGIPDGVISRGR